MLDCWLCLLHFLTVPHGKEVELDGGALLHLLHLRLRLNLLNWLRLLLHDFRGIGLIIIHKVLIQVTLEILCKQLGNPLHTAVMGANQCRLAVGVGAFLHLRGHDSLRIRGHHRLPPVAVHRDVRPILTAHSLEACVHIAKSLRVGVERHIIAGVFLEDYQIGAHIRSCLVAEHAVRQTEGSHQSGVPGQFLTDGVVGRRVHESPGGDKCHKTALTYLVEGFQEEIVVDGRDGIAFRIVATLAVFIIHHLDVTEGNIRCRNVKCPLQL